MRKILVPTVMAVACGAAVAQTTPTPTVTLYGIVDAGVTYTTGLKANKNQVVSGIMDGSRFGLRGNEDIGGGYRALFTLENRTELNTGAGSNRPPSGSQVPDRLIDSRILLPALCSPSTPSGPNGLPSTTACPIQAATSGVAASLGATLGVNLDNNFWDRQAYVGLVTPFGAFIAGRQYTPTYEVLAGFDTLLTQSSLSVGQVGSLPPAVTIRASNALQYRIQMGGLTASAMYAYGGVAGNEDADLLMGAMAQYKTDAFAVGIGYTQKNNDIGLESLKSLIIGGSFRLGPGTVSGLYGDIEDENPSGVSSIGASLAPAVGAGAAALVQSAYKTALSQDAQLWQIGYRMTTGPNTFYVAYNTYDDKKAANADVASYGVVYTYALSKRTDLNLVYTHFDNKGLGQAAPGQAGFLGGVTESAGTDSNNLAFGVRHRF